MRTIIEIAALILLAYVFVNGIDMMGDIYASR